MRLEAEFLRTGVTVGQFLAYVRAGLRKRGMDEWADGIDYDNFIADYGVDGEIDHKEMNDEVYAQLGVEYEIVRDRAYDKQTYERKANGKVSNEIIEFVFDDEKTGHGYYYVVEDGVETEAEPVESATDKVTEAETEAETESESDEPDKSDKSDDNIENGSRHERATTNKATKDADNLKTAREEKNMKETMAEFKPIPLHSVGADAKIAAALEAVQGRCKARTISTADIRQALERIEWHFDIPKCKLDGVEVMCDIHAQSFPNSYRFTPESTVFTAENRRGKWYLTGVRRMATSSPTKAVWVRTMPEETREAIIERCTLFGL